MSDRGDWGPPSGGGAPGHDAGARDSSEDLTVPRTVAFDAQAMRAAGISAPGSFPANGAAATPHPKKSKKGLIIGGCGGCLFILLSICCCSGYLLYLEEGVSYDDPGEELEEFTIAQGEPFQVEVRWDGTGYARLRAYVDVGEDAPSDTTVSGVFGCSDYGQLELADVSETLGLQYGAVPPGLVRMPRVYTYLRDGETMRCEGRLTSSPATPMRLVITERQRPSDWLSEWF